MGTLRWRLVGTLVSLPKPEIPSSRLTFAAYSFQALETTSLSPGSGPSVSELPTTQPSEERLWPAESLPTGLLGWNNFQSPRHTSSVDANRGDHFLHADF